MIIVNVLVPSNILSDVVEAINESVRADEVDIMAVRGKFINILLMHRETWE